MVISNEKTLRELVAEIPGAARILEKYRIDYCCGGKHALKAACRERGITQEVLLSELERAATLQPQTGEREWKRAPLRELIDHIRSCHHTYSKSPGLVGPFSQDQQYTFPYYSPNRWSLNSCLGSEFR